MLEVSFTQIKLFCFTVLMLIARVSLLEISSQLIKRFLDAAHFNDVHEVVDMLRVGVPIDSRDEDGYTALYWAVFSNHTEIVHELLKKRADVNVQNRYHWTPLHAAAQEGHTGIMKDLLQNDADPSILNSKGQTAFDVALMFNQEGAAQLLEGYWAHAR